MGSSKRAAEPPRKPKRFGEPMKFLPVVFVAFTILTIYVVYSFCHCTRMLQAGKPPEHVDADKRWSAKVQLVFFNVWTFMLVWCYIRAIVRHPGAVPDNDPRWESEFHRQERNTSEHAPVSMQETKKSGERRHCKWCIKYKPDRTHHCRVCKTCVLKMDHHCPWLYNCVGFSNYKDFFLVLFYAFLASHQVVWFMSASITEIIYAPRSFLEMFCLFFGETLAVFLCSLVTLFLIFHMWLISKATSTIEFCEKSNPKSDGDSMKSKACEVSAYDIGIYGNIRAVLGECPLLWLVPFHLPDGDGLSFVSDETQLTIDVEFGQGIRRTMHKPTQRSSRHSVSNAKRGAARSSTAWQCQKRSRQK